MVPHLSNTKRDPLFRIAQKGGKREEFLSFLFLVLFFFFAEAVTIPDDAGHVNELFPAENRTDSVDWSTANSTARDCYRVVPEV